MHRPKYTLQCFCSLWKKDSLIFKTSSCVTHFLHCVYYWYYLLQWMFFTACDNWKTLSFTKSLLLLWGFLNHHVCAFFDPSALKKVCMLFVISKITVQHQFNKVTAKFQNKAVLYNTYFLYNAKLLAIFTITCITNLIKWHKITK